MPSRIQKDLQYSAFFSESQRACADLVHTGLVMQKPPMETHSLLCREYNILWILIARVNQKTCQTNSLSLQSLAGPVSSKRNKECNKLI